MAKDFLKYVNHKGATISFGEKGLFIDESELRDWAYSYTTKNGRLVNFYKDIVEKKLPVVVMADSEAEGKELRDKLYEVISVDIEAQQYGKLIYNGYEMSCMMIAESHKSWLEYYAFGDIELTVITDKPYWLKTTTQQYKATDFIGGKTGIDAKGYPYGYDFNYGLAEINAAVVNIGSTAANFRLEIKGYAAEPELIINGLSYKLNYTVQKNTVAVIDTLNREIYVVTNSGAKINILDKRATPYIFTKLAAGNNIIQWDKSFDFALTLLYTRSEPKWN